MYAAQPMMTQRSCKTKTKYILYILNMIYMIYILYVYCYIFPTNNDDAELLQNDFS